MANTNTINRKNNRDKRLLEKAQDPKGRLLLLLDHWENSCLRKHRFNSELEAFYSTLGLLDVGVEVNPYFCFHCEGYHVGHKLTAVSQSVTEIARRYYVPGERCVRGAGNVNWKTKTAKV